MVTVNKISLTRDELWRRYAGIKQSVESLINLINKGLDASSYIDKTLGEIAAFHEVVSKAIKSVTVEFAHVYDLSPEGGGGLRMEVIAQRLKHLLDEFHRQRPMPVGVTIEAQPTIVGMGGAGKVNLRAIHMQAYITYYYANCGCWVKTVSPKAKNNIHFATGLDYDTLHATIKGDNKKIRKLHTSKNFEYYLQISDQAIKMSDIKGGLLNHTADAFMQLMAVACRCKTLITGVYE
jgi:hypothetical protein